MTHIRKPNRLISFLKSKCSKKYNVKKHVLMYVQRKTFQIINSLPSVKGRMCNGVGEERRNGELNKKIKRT